MSKVRHAAIVLSIALVAVAVGAPASQATVRTCGTVPLYVSAAKKVKQKGTSCRRARQIAKLWQTNVACADGYCRLYGFECHGESVDSEHYAMRTDVTCDRLSVARVSFIVVVP